MFVLQCPVAQSFSTLSMNSVDPGYIATSAMLVQSALALLEEKDSLPPR